MNRYRRTKSHTSCQLRLPRTSYPPSPSPSPRATLLSYSFYGRIGASQRSAISNCSANSGRQFLSARRLRIVITACKVK